AALVPVALTVPALCVALFSPLAGWLSDKVGRKRLLVLALAIYGVVGFVPWFLETLPAIIAARFGLGIVEAVIMTVSTALIGDYYQGKARDRWIALQIAVGSIAGTVLLAGGGLLGDVFGSRGPFLLYLSGLLVALAAALILHEPGKTAGGPDKVRSSFLATLQPILPLVLITFGVGVVFYVIFVQIGPILELSGPVSAGTVGIAGAIVNLGVVAGALVYKRWSAAEGPLLLAAGLALAAVGYAGVALATGMVAIAAFATLACVGSGVMLPNMLGWTMRRLPAARRGSGMGTWTGSFFLGQFFAPLMVGAMATRLGGLSAVIGVMAVIIAIAAAGSLVMAVTGGKGPVEPVAEL
ncbi:MAG TPA: MFS transporter, partial [Paracoccaceae bacterium]|nr:MFS transporter [Paracoccaceae bacterium]